MIRLLSCFYEVPILLNFLITGVFGIGFFTDFIIFFKLKVFFYACVPELQTPLAKSNSMLLDSIGVFLPLGFALTI